MKKLSLQEDKRGKDDISSKLNIFKKKILMQNIVVYDKRKHTWVRLRFFSEDNKYRYVQEFAQRYKFSLDLNKYISVQKSRST